MLQTINAGRGKSSAGPLARLARIARAGEWWEYKLVPILGLFYATAVLLDEPIASLWPAALTLLLALAPGAAWVSIVNDVTDRDDDRRAGKANRMEGRSRPFMAAAIAAPMGVGLAFAWMWRADPPLLAAYMAAWAAFALYSVPPFRLKARGLAGPVADAAGSNLFPTMVAVLLAFRAAEAPVDTLWLAAAAALSFAWGLRGILRHQLLDEGHDRAAGVSTFAQRNGGPAAVRLAKGVAFPIELVAIAWLIGRLGEPGPFAALLLYALLMLARLPKHRMRATIVEPGPRTATILQEYHDFFLPVALLIGSAVRHPADLIVVAAHLLLFPRRLVQISRDAWDLLRR